MKSIQPNKQRKKIFNAPQHKKRKWMSSHLEENLLLKYDKRAISVIKGDTVKVMRGSFKGHEDKVARVNVKKRYLEIEGLIMSKADGNKIAKPIHPSNVMITKLNLTDKWRRMKLERGLSEETKKEIEKEAEEQIKKEEAEKKRLEEEAKTLEEAEEEISEEKPTEEKTKKKEEKTKIDTKAENKKEKTQKKKTTPKKTPAKTTKKPEKGKKTAPKKTPAKTQKKTEEKSK